MNVCKTSLAFRKPATAVASLRPARADGPKVGLDGHASLRLSSPGELRGAMGRLGYLSAGGPKAMFVVDAGRTMLECTINAFA